MEQSLSTNEGKSPPRKWLIVLVTACLVVALTGFGLARLLGNSSSEDVAAQGTATTTTSEERNDPSTTASEVDDVASSSTTTTTVPSTEPPPTTPPTTTPVEYVLTETGLGPLQLGMTQDEAVATGLLAAVETICEDVQPFQNAKLNIPGVEGSVSFTHGVLDVVTVGTGVTTSPGGAHRGMVASDFVSAFEAAGYDVEIDDGSMEVLEVMFLTVQRDGVAVFGTTAGAMTDEIYWISIPRSFSCE